MNDRRRVVITGVGLVSPLAVGTEETWSGLMDGRSGVGALTRVDASLYTTKIAAEVRDFDAERFLPRKDIRRVDLFIQFALAAAALAREDSGLEIDDRNADRVATVVGSGMGGLPLIEHMHGIWRDRGPRRVSPFFIPGLIANMASGQISIRHGAKGPNTCPTTACTTGLHGVGDAFRLIQHGYADAAFAGGTEATTSDLALAGFGAMKALSVRNDEPARASRPWDVGRDGFVLGEGAGVLILEERQAALARGAEPYAEILGYGMSADAYHVSAPEPTGDGAARVMRAALDDAGIAAERVDYVNAHGTSTPLGDIAEVRAIKRVFGDHAYRLAVSSTKSSTGHLLGAAGGVEAGILALAVHRQVLPATLNLDQPDEECDLDFVPHESRDARVDVALTNSFGFGGTNGALIMARA
ncbi:MAG: beta-ketoacyl-ACP synthase II [Acidobacteria bacterium]|nr:beta-ketoacyl-ACP synthase II [Acidobacteriota bacterium]MCY3966051.1 beta-ketoacyl-ACP synthase II [Acidobacteriota bacterium]